MLTRAFPSIKLSNQKLRHKATWDLSVKQQDTFKSYYNICQEHSSTLASIIAICVSHSKDNPFSQKVLTVTKKLWAPNLPTLETLISILSYGLRHLQPFKATQPRRHTHTKWQKPQIQVWQQNINYCNEQACLSVEIRQYSPSSSVTCIKTRTRHLTKKKGLVKSTLLLRCNLGSHSHRMGLVRRTGFATPTYPNFCSANSLHKENKTHKSETDKYGHGSRLLQHATQYSFPPNTSRQQSPITTQQKAEEEFHSLRNSLKIPLLHYLILQSLCNQVRLRQPKYDIINIATRLLLAMSRPVTQFQSMTIKFRRCWTGSK